MDDGAKRKESEKYCPKSTETPYSVISLSSGSKKVTPFVPDGNKLSRELIPPSGSGNPPGNHDLRISISALLSFVGVLNAQRYMGFPIRLLEAKAGVFVFATVTEFVPGQGELALPKEFQETKLVLRKLRKLVVLV